MKINEVYFCPLQLPFVFDYCECPKIEWLL